MNNSLLTTACRELYPNIPLIDQEKRGLTYGMTFCTLDLQNQLQTSCHSSQRRVAILVFRREPYSVRSANIAEITVIKFK